MAIQPEVAQVAVRALEADRLARAAQTVEQSGGEPVLDGFVALTEVRRHEQNGPVGEGEVEYHVLGALDAVGAGKIEAAYGIRRCGHRHEQPVEEDLVDRVRAHGTHRAPAVEHQDSRRRAEVLAEDDKRGVSAGLGVRARRIALFPAGVRFETCRRSQPLEVRPGVGAHVGRASHVPRGEEGALKQRHADAAAHFDPDERASHVVAHEGYEQIGLIFRECPGFRCAPALFPGITGDLARAGPGQRRREPRGAKQGHDDRHAPEAGEHPAGRLCRCRRTGFARVLGTNRRIGHGVGSLSSFGLSASG